MENPYCGCERTAAWLTAVVPMENPYRSCRLTRDLFQGFSAQGPDSGGLQVSQWPTAAIPLDSPCCSCKPTAVAATWGSCTR